MKIFKHDYNGEFAWAYELKNTINGKWYIGIGQGDIEEYDTSSYCVELRAAISRGEVEKHIIHADNSYETMKIWETQKLHELDAKNDECSYNENNGFAQIKKIPRIAMMKKIADESRLEGSYCNIIPTIIDLEDEKKYNLKSKKGMLKDTCQLNDQGAFQPRVNMIDPEHLRTLMELIDQYRGNIDAIFKETGQKLLGVVLLNRKRHNKPSADMRIDGNHTFNATVESEYGFTLSQLYLPESMHGDWTDVEIRLLGEFLNPIRKAKTLETQEVDAVKTCTELTRTYGDDSSVINDYLTEHGFTKKAKDRIRSAVKRNLKKIKDQIELPENFLTYATEDERKPMNYLVNEYKKETGTWSVCWSTGKTHVGDWFVSIMNNVYDNEKINVKKVRIVLWHPNPSSKEKFEKDYEKGFKNLRRILKHENVDFNFEVMDTTKKEAA